MKENVKNCVGQKHNKKSELLQSDYVNAEDENEYL